MDRRLSFAFHAAPPPGEWLNDPNGLVFADGAWRLFAQHSAAAPDFGKIGWGRLSSTDCLRWTWDGEVIAPDALGQAYSGSIVAQADSLTAYLTRHDDTLKRQLQVELTSRDAGASWHQGTPLGPEGRNVRDPFVFFCAATGDCRMLIAEPCDWYRWADEAPSTLGVWRLDGKEWRFVSRIAAWFEPGVACEVPVLVDFGSCQALIVSTVDRRNGGAECAVRYWLGQFDGASFSIESAPEGRLLDHGPDFYAAIVNTIPSPGEERMLVAWASSWETARVMPWPGGIKGGPICLPRLLLLDTAAGRLVQQPIAGIDSAATHQWDGETPMTISIAGEDAEMKLTFRSRALAVQRDSLGGQFDWERSDESAFVDGAAQTIRIFADAGLIEAFIEPAGLTVTAFVPGAQL